MGVYLWTEQQGWQPGANTIAYYPLKENLNDYSGNGYNMTNSGITFSDGVAVLDGSQRATIPNVTGYKTICLWFKKTNDYNGMIYAQGNTDGYVQLRTNGFAGAGDGGGHFNADFTAGGSTPSNVWRCFVMTQTVANNSGAGTGAFDFYLSDFGGVSGIRRFDGSSTHYFNRPLATFGWSGNTSYPYAIIADVSALIIEDKARTQQEIEDYYNQTKDNYSEETVQTFDFQNDGSLNWTGYSIGYGTPDYVTGQGRKIGTSSSDSYQGGITIPNSVFQGELKSIKIYWYKPETTASYSGSAVGICNQNQSTNCEYGRSGSGGGININGTRISAIDSTGEITTEWIMESNGDLTVKINDTSYNVGSYASTFKDLRTNKALYIEMGRWDKPPHYIRKIEITTV